MRYYAFMQKELLRSGIQEGEFAIYTGTMNPRQASSLSPTANSRNAFAYIWKNSQPKKLNACFWSDWDSLDILRAQTENEDAYVFTRDKPSGYIRQLSGPAKPIIVANLGAIPLRVDTFLGKFMVHAGTILRLDENAPRREKKKVLLTFSSQYKQPLESAELWNGNTWQRLNICKEPYSFEEGHSLTVRDGSAIVQYVEAYSTQKILMPNSPEPDPDYEVFITGKTGNFVKLCFDRLDYQNGQLVHRTRTLFFDKREEPVAYDLQKLRESSAQELIEQCAVKLPGWEPASIPGKKTLLPAPEPPEIFPEQEKANKGAVSMTARQLPGQHVQQTRSLNLTMTRRSITESYCMLRKTDKIYVGGTLCQHCLNGT